MCKGREFRRDRVQSHIWLKASSNMTKYLRFSSLCPSSYMTLHPIPSEFPYLWANVYFIFYQRGDSKNTNERGPSLVGTPLGLSCRYKRLLSCLGCSSGPSTKYVAPHCTLLQFICPRRPASWADSRAGSPVSWHVSLPKTPPPL